MMNDADAHRLPVIDGGGELVSLLSQSRVVDFLTKHQLKFSEAFKTIEQLGFAQRPVVTIKSTDSTVDAFQCLRKHGSAGRVVWLSFVTLLS